MIKLEMLRVFRIVAEQGNLSGAAKELGRTPSAVSMMLAQLEDHIGAPLFETDRKNRLTTLGRLVFEESNRATDAFARSLDAIERHRKSNAGTVRIATVPSATVTLLPEMVMSFRVSYPDVRLEISDVDSAAVHRRIRYEEADIGIVSAFADDGLTNDASVIMYDDLGIVSRADGEIARAARSGAEHLGWDILERESLIANPLCQMVGDPAVQRLLLTCTLEARNTTALLSFVRRGLGATILPHSTIKEQSQELAFFAPPDLPVRRALLKIANPERTLNPAAMAFWNRLVV
ncbi:LysR family transcriptional regulator [Sedimentitalea todarodis]|uniref:LysR family transcriptional regulator n=1 Tax=Sedimentitalea todarodis TaxID=1631240 RepID=A0ABU3VIH7_9RHOB|nr:LysR family transcriptional regulator [Sedimentitalea todarodis]MDU9005964.1 LysR family transcriptional regulator [Sedimentitalea todarodis]